MKRNIIIEVIWLAGIFIAAFLLLELFPSNSILDINLHDTYIYNGGNHKPNFFISFLFAYFITISFWVYLIRATYREFKIMLVDVILLIIAGLLIYFYDNVTSIYMILTINRSPSMDTGSPGIVKGLFYGGSYSQDSILVRQIFKIILILLFGFTGYITGKNYRKFSQP